MRHLFVFPSNYSNSMSLTTYLCGTFMFACNRKFFILLFASLHSIYCLIICVNTLKICIVLRFEIAAVITVDFLPSEIGVSSGFNSMVPLSRF